MTLKTLSQDFWDFFTSFTNMSYSAQYIKENRPKNLIIRVKGVPFKTFGRILVIGLWLSSEFWSIISSEDWELNIIDMHKKRMAKSWRILADNSIFPKSVDVRYQKRTVGWVWQKWFIGLGIVAIGLVLVLVKFLN